MKISSTILAALLCLSSLYASEFFDDFSYKNTLDPKLNEHGWTIIDGIDSPPRNAHYKKTYVSFEEDPNDINNSFITLKASCRHSVESMRLSRIESDLRFFEGTYATRIHFDNQLRKTKDGNIQAFYTISSSLTEGTAEYSECDFEYLPYDVWNRQGKTKPAFYLTSWETYISEQGLEDFAQYSDHKRLKGWHLIVIQIMNGQVTYYLDNSKTPLATLKISDKGSDTYPESIMKIAFANWITKTNPKKNTHRSSTIKVDWVYHIENQALSLNEVYRRVRLLQKDDIRFIDSLDD
ncbi:MAG: glycoside hydrolase family 16 protein [Candidatus Neomarinimicrobiota bacterium]